MRNENSAFEMVLVRIQHHAIALRALTKLPAQACTPVEARVATQAAQHHPSAPELGRVRRRGGRGARGAHDEQLVVDAVVLGCMDAQEERAEWIAPRVQAAERRKELAKATREQEACSPDTFTRVVHGEGGEQSACAQQLEACAPCFERRAILQPWVLREH